MRSIIVIAWPRGKRLALWAIALVVIIAKRRTNARGRLD